MKKGKNNHVALSVTALTPAQIEQVKAIAEENTISNTAVLRQALVQFLDQTEDAIAPYIDRDYGACEPFTNIYCSPDTVASLDALTEKFDKSRNQVIRGGGREISGNSEERRDQLNE